MQILVAVLFHLESFVHVALFDVRKLCQRHAALVALGHFLGVVLEALQGRDLVLGDDDAVRTTRTLLSRVILPLVTRQPATVPTLEILYT